jgi:hypothetical protein
MRRFVVTTLLIAAATVAATTTLAACGGVSKDDRAAIDDAVALVRPASFGRVVLDERGGASVGLDDLPRRQIVIGVRDGRAGDADDVVGSAEARLRDATWGHDIDAGQWVHEAGDREVRVRVQALDQRTVRAHDGTEIALRDGETPVLFTITVGPR